MEDILATEVESSVANLVKVKDKFGKTPLHFACSAACFEVANLLITNGAAPEQINGTGYNNYLKRTYSYHTL